MAPHNRDPCGPPSRSPSTPATASRPASPPPTAPAPSGCSPTRPPSLRPPRSRGTSSPSGPARAASWSVPGTPRRRSTWPGSRASRRSASSASSSRTTASMTRMPGVLALAAREGLPVPRHRRPRPRGGSATTSGSSGSPTPSCRRPTARSAPSGYRDLVTGRPEHLALGELKGAGGAGPARPRVHSECLTGDVLGSAALRLRSAAGPPAPSSGSPEEGGVVVYLRGHEGRGVGLVAKLRAYRLQDGGRDTVDANLELGLPADARDYGAAAEILVDLDSGGPADDQQPRQGRQAARVRRRGRRAAPLTPLPDHNLAYLLTKRDRMGHHLPGLDADGDGESAATSGTEQHEMSGQSSAVTADGASACGSRSSPRAGTRSSWTGSSLAPGAGCRPPGRGPPRPSRSRHLRAAGAAGALARQGRRPRRPRRRHARRYPALRLRLQRGDRRPRSGSPSTTAYRSGSACSPATPRSRLSTGPAWRARCRGQGVRGDRGRARDRARHRRVSGS